MNLNEGNLVFLFRLILENDENSINICQIKIALNFIGIDTNYDDLEEKIKSIEGKFDKNNTYDINTFTSIVLSYQNGQFKEKLVKYLFSLFDIENKGFITFKNLKNENSYGIVKNQLNDGYLIDMIQTYCSDNKRNSLDFKKLMVQIDVKECIMLHCLNLQSVIFPSTSVYTVSFKRITKIMQTISLITTE
ncbi:hypothetical protein A3Q56_00762 [Intoshia linei]|uniref:EF-hand domain-containing protein n=1 Tax=Intoshia linei TaxID=1819745 RepID=A0A177BAW7_9BILA|nr:hypothetical protein A3Q56_00762 [Intoshia linei]